MLVTIFTPTYNRAPLLFRLYESLEHQTSKNFEWLIVDDGSSDNTEDVVKEFIRKSTFSIRYVKQDNSGKHIAINQGVKLAGGVWFFIVDSDDYLTVDAIESVANVGTQILDNHSFSGFSFRKGFDENSPIGTLLSNYKIEASSIEFRFNYKINGDMAEVFRTSVLKEFPFPHVHQEKFCPEALVWNRISLKYKMLWLSKIIYIAEYLEGGLSDNIYSIRRKAPILSCIYYSELEQAPIPWQQKLKANINFWRFARFTNKKKLLDIVSISMFISIIGRPLSWVFLIKDRN